MRPHLPASTLAVLLLSASLPCSSVLAANAGFLKDTALTYLTDDDRKMQVATALAVLEGADANGAREWSNPATGASGRSQSLGNFKSSDGLHCRKLKLSTQAKGIDSEFAFPVCKGKDGEWFIASGKELKKA